MSEILGFQGKVDFTQAKKDVKDFEKYLSTVGISLPKDISAKTFDTKPLTEYQKEVIRIKQETLELAKAKAETTKADRAASLATQAALREEIRLKKEAASVKRPVDFGNSQAEIDLSNAGRAAGGGRVASSGTAELVRLLNEDFAAGKIGAAEYKAEIERLNAIMKQTSSATKEADGAIKGKTLSAKEQARLLAEEKYLQSQATKELKNNIREQLNAKGSTEARRAALIRLQTAFDRLSATERASPAGQRLEGIVGRLNTQVLSLEKSTGRSGRNVGNYLNQAWSGLKTIANILPGMGIAGVLAFAIDPLMEYIKSLDLFKSKLSQVKLAQTAVSEALKGGDYTQAVKNVEQLRINVDLAKKGLYDKKAVVDEYNKSIGVTAGQVKNLDEVEANLVKNADAYIQMTLYKAAANLQLQKAAEKAAEIQELSRKKTEEFANSFDKVVGGAAAGGGGSQFGVSTFDSGAYEKALKEEGEKRKEVRHKELKKEKKDFTDNASSLMKTASEEAKKMGGVLGADTGAATKASTKALNAALSAAESLSKKLTDIHNASFRKTLSNDDAEIQAVKDKYEAMRVEAKKFYEEFGNKPVKINGKNVSKDQVFGTLKADEQSEKDAILAQRKADKDKKEQEAAQKHYETLLKDFMDYGQKMDKLKADFEADSLLLINDPRQQAVRKAAYDKDVQDLVDTNSKKLDEYEKLIEGIEKLSRKEALAALEVASKRLADDKGAGLVSDKVAKETEALFAKTKKAIIKGTKEAGEELIALANQIDQLASEVDSIDEAFGKVLRTVSNVVGQVGNIQKGMSDFNKEGASPLDKLTAGLGMIGAGISIFKSVFSLFDRSAQREEQAAYARDLQNKQTEALNKSLERQISLLNDAYGTDRLLKYNEAIKQATENQAKYQQQLNGKYQLTGDKAIDKQLEKLNSGEWKLGGDMTSLLIKDLIKKGAVNTLPTDIRELEKLLDEGKLDSGTAVIVQNLIKANESAEQLKNQLRAENVGAGLSTIVDEFMDSLTDGVGGVEDALTKAIRRGLLNSLKGDITEKFLQDYYEMLDKALIDGNISADEDALLREQLRKADEYGKERLDYINKTAPETKEPDKKTGISGAIVGEALKEDTANRMLGLQQGQYDATKQIGLTMGDMLQIGRSKLAALEKIAANTLRGADNTEGHTTLLNKIAENTTPKSTTSDPLGQSLRDNGIKI
ncbi:hypothetical protein [Pedobacter nyackensis]|uniref:Uncharacterized protein n=1 Tax=Pedobacter nyackensis TaxID=475255 RepID=A0A1W1ZYS5_9SPHI|nr:hypothetical protein [Pedobacter nyackensis]SMC53301.1 hypothetical protein SAMN04488101_101146 [Pedobacter nyackensis]